MYLFNECLNRQEAFTQAEEQKRNDFKAGRAVGLSGREMFAFDPALAADDDDDEAVDLRYYDDEEEQDETEYRDIQLDLIGMEAAEVCHMSCLLPLLMKLSSRLLSKMRGLAPILHIFYWILGTVDYERISVVVGRKCYTNVVPG